MGPLGLRRSRVSLGRWRSFRAVLGYHPGRIFAGMVSMIMGFFLYFGGEFLNWDLARWMGVGMPDRFCAPIYLGCVTAPYWSYFWDWHFALGITGFFLTFIGCILASYYIAKGIIEYKRSVEKCTKSMH